MATAEDTIVCQIDNQNVHSIAIHIKNSHPDWTIDRYKTTYPGEPLFSEFAKEHVAKSKQKKADAIAAESEKSGATSVLRVENFHDVFGFGAAPAARSIATGNPIEIKTFTHENDEDALPYIAEVDEGYVFNIDLTKKVLMAMELNVPLYLWGYHGTGKTSVLEQYCARTGRLFSRLQHTINTEESQVVGQYVVKDGGTVFQPGPLALAVRFGHVYCADEYDMAMPAVIALYQAVLEGKPLVIKEAPIEWRIVRPHPNFRIVATGNTNGIGDETGLYQGTQIQNAANYSRFTITEEVTYMDAAQELAVVMSKTRIDKKSGEKLIKIAKEIRQMFADGKISMTISPREIINAARLGIAMGHNWKDGLKLAFSNRLSRVDMKVVSEFSQRIFG